MRTRIEIDPNVRVGGGETYAGFEDAEGGVTVGATVTVHESETGLSGVGLITKTDKRKRLIWLAIDWAGLSVPEAP